MKLDIQLFASGTFDLTKGTGSASWKSLQGRVVWSSIAGTSEQNYSTIAATIYVKSWTGGTTGTWPVWISIDGNVVVNTGVYKANVGSDWVELASGTIILPHNEDGSKSASLVGKVSGPNGTSLSGVSSEGTTSITLDSIARASVVTCDTGVTIGNGLTIYSNRKSNFYHRAVIDFGSFSKTIDFEDRTTWMTGNDANSLYAQISTASAGTGGVTLYTYSDSTYTTQIGSATSTTFVLYADYEACRPTIDSADYEDTNSIITELTGNNRILVTGYSKPKVTWTDSAKYSYSIPSRQVNGVNATSPYTFTYCPENIEISVVDNVGRPSYKLSIPLTIKYYTNLTLNASITRNAPTDGSATLTINGNFWNGNFGSTDNELTTFKYRYKKVSETDYSEWITATPTISDNSYTFTQEWSSGFDYQSNYDFQVSVSDRLVSYEEIHYTLLQGIPVMTMGADGIEVNGTITGTLNGNAASSSSCSGNSETATTASQTTGTLTIQRNGTQVGTFNGSSNQTINISGVQLEPVSLYDYATGTSSNFNLSETSANFTYLEIFYKTNDNYYSSVKVYSPNGKNVSLSANFDNGNYTWIKTGLISISGATITFNRNSEARIGNEVATTHYTQDVILITKVIGYR